MNSYCRLLGVIVTRQILGLETRHWHDSEVRAIRSGLLRQPERTDGVIA